MARQAEKPRFLVVFYANPDRYPPTLNAIRLLRDRYRVAVVCRNDDDPRAIAWPDDVEVHRLGPARSPDDRANAGAVTKALEYARFSAAVATLIRRHRPACVLAYEPYAFVAAIAVAGAVPVVYQRHEVEELESVDSRSLGGWVLRASLKLTSRAALVIFPEKNRAAYHMRFTTDPREPLVVPNFPLLESFPPVGDLGNLCRERCSQPVVFYRGAVGGDNGILEAIGAIAHLPSEFRLRLLGAATPAFLDEMRANIASAGLESRVSYGGFLPSFEDVNRETRAALVGLVLYRAVHTNWQHAGSATNKLYEYAASALPAVVPDRVSFREFLVNESWVEYCDPDDAASVALAIRRTFTTPESYEARARAARAAFEDRFNYERVFVPVLEHIGRLAGTSPRGIV